jgi:hypothetical protein
MEQDDGTSNLLTSKVPILVEDLVEVSEREKKEFFIEVQDSKFQRYKYLFVQQMIRSNFSIPFLNHLANGLDFYFLCLPPRGWYGGILLALVTKLWKKVENGDYCEAKS